MILNIYKPKDWTSFDVLAKLKGKLKLKKAGHAGTLDPLAEGVLIVLTDSDTKNQDKYMKSDKEYVCDVTFNLDSPTLDLEILPEVSLTLVSLDFVKESLPNVLNKFLGDQEQVVPVFSAKKVHGKPMYKLARENLNKNPNLSMQNSVLDQVSIPLQKIKIYEIESQNYFLKEINTSDGLRNFPTVTLKVVCSSGTYIRSLARDLGSELGTKAILTKLIRTKVGDFKVEDSKQLSEF